MKQSPIVAGVKLASDSMSSEGTLMYGEVEDRERRWRLRSGESARGFISPHISKPITPAGDEDHLTNER